MRPATGVPRQKPLMGPGPVYAYSYNESIFILPANTIGGSFGEIAYVT